MPTGASKNKGHLGEIQEEYHQKELDKNQRHVKRNGYHWRQIIVESGYEYMGIHWAILFLYTLEIFHNTELIRKKEHLKIYSINELMFSIFFFYSSLSVLPS